MVLSNKKLKQKRRAELAQLLSSISNDSNAESHQPHQYLKQLPETQKKPRSKSAKRREKTLSVGGFEAANAISRQNDGAHLAQTELAAKKAGLRDNNGSAIDGGGVKGKKRKRTKKEKEGDPVSVVRGGDEENGDVGKETKKKNKKKKKKKKKKLQKKAELVANTGTEGVAEKLDDRNIKGYREIRNKVYAGGIPYYSTEDDIRSFFDHCGTITEVDCMKFPETGKFRGIAIISFKTEEAAKRALVLDGADMGGLILKIQPYKSTRDTEISDYSPPVIEGYNRIYVGNLSWDITEEDLRKLLSGCSISSLRFGEDKETGEFKGYAHVDLSDNTSLTKALKLDQRVVCGRPVRIRCAVQKKGVMVVQDSVQKNGVAVVQDSVPTAQTDLNPNDGGTSSSGKLKRRTCYDCGEKGHISSACPNKQDAN
ncbi:hypothetical protein Dimus_021129 [Dionaea muscipula]